MQHNNLAAQYPEISAQWDYELNKKGPEAYAPHSNAVVNWECIRKHKWRARINNRVYKHTGCPYCEGVKPIPGETDFEFLYPIIAAEWHPVKNGDAKPCQFLPKSNKTVWWQCAEKGHEWTDRINRRVEGKPCPYCAGERPCADGRNFKIMYPVLAENWDYSKNEKNPEEYLPKSHHKAWWNCPKGHGWQAAIYHVVNSFELNPLRYGCPFCAGKRACEDNCLPTVAPALYAEWNHSKNVGLSAYQFTLHSNQAVWWTCSSCGHEWKARINNRANGTGCPVCKHFVVSDLNRLSINDEEVSAEWNYKKNGDLTPDMVAIGSSIRCWWICPEGHEWQATVANRSILGHGCPYCKRRIPVRGKEDLATKNPELSLQWHPTKNGNLTPDMVFPTSDIKVWWRCERGHEWRAIIFFRNRGSDCPYCRGRKEYIGHYGSP